MTNPVAYVICMNDALEGVVLGTPAKAKFELEKLKKKHQKRFSPCKEYNDIFFWHVHDVEIL